MEENELIVFLRFGHVEQIVSAEKICNLSWKAKEKH